MKLDEALTFCEAERDWVVETIRALALLESPTSDKSAVDRCGAELCRRLERIGGGVEVLEQKTAGNHVRATFGEGPRQILLLGHLDTVWPVGHLARMPVRETAGVLSGPGVYDMKAGIALGMLAMRSLEARLPSLAARVVMLFTSDEEQGSLSSRSLVEDEARRSEAVLVLEPSLPGGGLKTARKGTGEFTLRVRGISAHAGIEPEKGASAVEELAHQVLAVGALRDPVRGVSVNVGRVEGGGPSNVVAEDAHALIDIRVSTLTDRRRVEEALGRVTPRLEGTSVVVSGGFSRPPLERTESGLRLYRIAKDVAATLGRDVAEGGTGGGSDGNLTAALGVPTLDGLGAVGDGAHALHEHVVIDELPWRAALLAGLVDRLGANSHE
jgi:glutamate carboxypeptidase